MGIKTIHVIACDGPGCDLTWQGEAGSEQPDYFIQPQTIEMKKQVLWSGYLCGPCETKVYNALVGALPRS